MFPSGALIGYNTGLSSVSGKKKDVKGLLLIATLITGSLLSFFNDTLFCAFNAKGIMKNAKTATFNFIW
jgi:hypothetical protein